jgi:hypothetical protein
MLISHIHSFRSFASPSVRERIAGVGLTHRVVISFSLALFTLQNEYHGHSISLGKRPVTIILVNFIFTNSLLFLFCSTRAWRQGLGLFKLLGHIGLTPALRCHNLKSNKQQQLFPGSLLAPKWRLESSSPIPCCLSLIFTALSFPPFPSISFFDGSIRDQSPLLDPPSYTSLQFWWVFPFIRVSLRSYCGCPTVDHRSTGWTRDSIYQLGRLTYYFLGMPRKYTCLRSIS